MKLKHDYTVSSGNVFADLGFTDPIEQLTKAELARQINNTIEQQGLTQKAAARLLDLDQPKISALSKGKLAGFSVERLFYLLNLLNYDITIKISKPAKGNTAQVNVQLPKIRKRIPAEQQGSTPSLIAQGRRKR